MFRFPFGLSIRNEVTFYELVFYTFWLKTIHYGETHSVVFCTHFYRSSNSRCKNKKTIKRYLAYAICRRKVIDSDYVRYKLRPAAFLSLICSWRGTVDRFRYDGNQNLRTGSLLNFWHKNERAYQLIEFLAQKRACLYRLPPIYTEMCENCV